MRTLEVARTANANFQNQINRSIIFNYLRNNSPTFRAKTARDLKISAPAVSRVIDTLIADGYVIETETPAPIRGGKKPRQLEINANKGRIIAFDLEKLKLAIADFRGNILSTHALPRLLDAENVSENFKNEILNALRLAQGEPSSETEPVEVKAICIGIPAAYDEGTEKIISAPLYESLRGLEVKKVIKEVTDIPVFVENIVKLSALAEKSYGIGQRYEDIVFIEVSNGVGAGAIVDNHLLKGSIGCAGEIGFTIIGPENLDYRSRNKGYLESIGSVESLKEKMVAELQRGKRSLALDLVKGEIGSIEAATVCEAALQKDALAVKIVSDAVNALSIGIINLLLVLNPQVVVLGGKICTLPGVQELFLAPIANHVRASVPFYEPLLALSKLGEDAGVVGAFYLAIEALIWNEFPYAIVHDGLALT
jgi:predicted NBD/HSP70 family sugar kinase